MAAIWGHCDSEELIPQLGRRARRIYSQLTDVKCHSYLETLYGRLFIAAMRVACCRCQLSILHLGETDAWGSFSNGYCWQWSMTSSSSSRVGCSSYAGGEGGEATGGKNRVARLTAEYFFG
jgi:hypothetical protein